LIGGSLTRRLAAAGEAVTGWDADPNTRADAQQAGLAVAPSLAALASRGGVIFIAVPLPALETVFAAITAAAPAETVLSDVTSVKQRVRAIAGSYGLSFVGGHPMAGTADSGFGAASAELLAGAAWVLTLDEETDLAAWLAVAAIVTAMGCRVVPCTSASHDEAVAKVSHLPHLLAAALVIGAAGDPLALSLAAGSFRDATRVAMTAPALAAAMCGGNADALDAQLSACIAQLDAGRRELSSLEGLAQWFAAAEAVRRSWPAVPSAETEVPAGAHLRDRLLDLGATGGHVVAVRPDGVVVRSGPVTSSAPGPA